ncbi:MAG: NAD(P)/FAD-dependent oxidoreductase [Solirubrobacteraceae bacterium]
MTRLWPRRRPDQPILRIPPRRPPPSSAHTSLWFEQALAREPEAHREPGPGLEPIPARADVCIVGGGFTGLWTALEIKRRRPSAEVVVLEADLCGSGASGRNGGFVLTSWSKFTSLRKACGEPDAVGYGRAVQAGVAAIGEFCSARGIEAQFRNAGWLWAATNDAQMNSWQEALELLDAAGASPFQSLSPEAVQAMTGSEVHRGGVLDPAAAIVQPAILARGLRAAALAAGVTVCEHATVHQLDGGSRPVLATSRGVLRAERVVVALGAWAAAIAEVRRALVVIASDVVATEPIPDRLAAIGWRPGLAISDSRRLVNYYRQSEDGRVVFGKGGGGVAYQGHIGASFLHESPRAQEVTGQLHYVYPMLADVPAPRSWRGPVDYSLSGLPFFTALSGEPAILVGAGFSGSGVGPAFVAGQILGAMALDQDDHPGPEGLCRIPGGAMPPEPFRFTGAAVVRAAVGRKESEADHGRVSGRLTQAVAALDPTSFVDAGTRAASRDDA